MVGPALLVRALSLPIRYNTDMENDINALAKELLIKKVTAHINSNATGMPQKTVIEQWYSECVALATAIIETTT